LKPLIAAAAVAAVLAGVSVRPEARAARTCTTSRAWLASWTQTFAGRVVRETVLFRRPGHDPVGHLATADAYGFPTTVSLLERRTVCGKRWYRVRYTAWPNGSSAWVRSSDIKTTRLRSRIVVDVSSRRLYFYRGGKLVLSSPAAIGKGSTPTPLGSFFVTQRFIVTNPSGPYGPRALGISAFSETLRSWVDGGPIGIHGTNERFSIGKPVSHGCVRLPNDTIVRLFTMTALGTPVLIRS